MNTPRILTMRLTSGVLSVEHKVEFHGEPSAAWSELVEDAFDEINHKLTVAAQALEPRGTFKELEGNAPPGAVLHHFEKWKGPMR